MASRTTLALLAGAALARGAAPPCPAPSTGAYTKHNITLADPYLVVSVIPYGATVTNVYVKGADGAVRDVILGFEDAEGYCNDPQHPYFGATVGRVANRIRNGTFTLRGTTYHLEKTEKGYDNLHSGPMGFDRQVFNLDASPSRLVWTHSVPEGHDGFPGGMKVTVTMSVFKTAAGAAAFQIETAAAEVTEATLFNPTFHGYFNLDGFRGAETVEEHVMHLPDAEQYVKVDGHLIPTGELGTAAADAWMDFRAPAALGAKLRRYAADLPTGYDTAFLASQASVTSARAGLRMDVAHDRASLQIYTSGYLNGTIPKKTTQGRGGYEQYAGVTFEPQWLPDAINHPEWWGFTNSTVVEDGGAARYAVTYAFSHV
eukprot:TRINITY_DN20432_c0_g1_i1.p2 TRINITY_DN20432_c0_g1~~TRINITY_DN20432_c0_g1_i1.p2  ORF type:complete len:372 (+),score=153.90 TRINITY_DN20432_c0_g1_i1:64-1179(+)